jgi:hypothetical protein
MSKFLEVSRKNLNFRNSSIVDDRKVIIDRRVSQDRVSEEYHCNSRR